jgi:anti-sigma regulatory factor (Ser/Thr protein kinase)
MRCQVELRLPPEPIAPTLARAAVAAIASGLPEAVASDIKLLATEIVSNAVRHANLDPSEEIILRIVMDGNIRVEITDPGPPFDPDLHRLDPGSSGWGLFLVDAIARSWGVEAEGTGKKVWFELGRGLGRATGSARTRSWHRWPVRGRRGRADGGLG